MGWASVVLVTGSLYWVIQTINPRHSWLSCMSFQSELNFWWPSWTYQSHKSRWQRAVFCFCRLHYQQDCWWWSCLTWPGWSRSGQCGMVQGWAVRHGLCRETDPWACYKQTDRECVMGCLPPDWGMGCTVCCQTWLQICDYNSCWVVLHLTTCCHYSLGRLLSSKVFSSASILIWANDFWIIDADEHRGIVCQESDAVSYWSAFQTLHSVCVKSCLNS